ncbi:DUF998 domain-containing protein [Streptomyces sp. NPDC002790]|uniref:DUF998 domain-containing protein n=1 Tax=Streptomyces sp. NPDC002790 TaxID=3154431 RepID=UPI00332BE88C
MRTSRRDTFSRRFMFSGLGRRLAPLVWTTVVVAMMAALLAPRDTDPGLSQLSLTVSDFAALDRGGPIETAMASLGVVSLLLLVVARKRLAAIRGLPSVLLAIWGAGLVLAAVAPTDPLTTQLTGSAYVHRYASVAAFAALPTAGLVLAGRLNSTAGRTSWWLRTLSLLAVVGAGVMAYSAGPGGRELIGLVERLMLGCEVIMVGVLGRYVQGLVPGTGGIEGVPESGPQVTH